MTKNKISAVLCTLATVGGIALGLLIPCNNRVQILIICALGCPIAVGLVLFLLFYLKDMRPTFEVFQKYRYLLSNLIIRDLKVKYRKSVLGFLWSILNPLLMALVISAVFSHVFRVNAAEIGGPFIVYYLSGALIFNFMTEATTGSLTSVLGASSLIKKVYIPKYIFPLEKCVFAFVNMLFSSVALIVIVLINIKQLPNLGWSALLFFFPMITSFVFALGLSLALSSLNVFFRDIGHLYSVWTVAWMYLTPIIYPESVINNMNTVVRTIAHLNPMYYYVTYFRQVLMLGTVPNLYFHAVCVVFAVASLAVGLLIFKKQQDRFILYI